MNEENDLEIYADMVGDYVFANGSIKDCLFHGVIGETYGYSYYGINYETGEDIPLAYFGFSASGLSNEEEEFQEFKIITKPGINLDSPYFEDFVSVQKEFRKSMG